MHVVYRCFDVDGRLLYVGCTSNLERRLTKHRTQPSSRTWYPRLNRVKARIYPTRHAAMWAETVAIRTEQPLFNSVHNPNPPSDRRPGRPKGYAIDAAKVRALLLAQRRTQTDLARAADVSTAQLSNVMHGHTGCSPLAADRLADALGVTVSDIFPELKVAA